MLTDRFASALQLSFSLHKEQKRKSSDIPYYVHLMSVASLVLENGGDEDAAIAALLHDAVEDQGGAETASMIRKEFGDDVADIVSLCTEKIERDADGNKLDWRGRKQHHIDYLVGLRGCTLTGIEQRALLVMCADKLHNMKSTYESALREGDAVYEAFRGGKQGTLWYLRSMADALTALLGEDGLAGQLNIYVSLLENGGDSSMKKIVVLYSEKYGDRYWDASTEPLKQRAMKEIFETLDDESRYKALDDEAHIKQIEDEIEGAEFLRKALDAGKLPVSMAYDVAQKIARADELRGMLDEVKDQAAYYKKAVEGDSDSIWSLLTLRQDYEDEAWDLIALQ